MAIKRSANKVSLIEHFFLFIFIPIKINVCQSQHHKMVYICGFPQSVTLFSVFFRDDKMQTAFEMTTKKGGEIYLSGNTRRGRQANVEFMSLSE